VLHKSVPHVLRRADVVSAIDGLMREIRRRPLIDRRSALIDAADTHASGRCAGYFLLCRARLSTDGSPGA